ncbi:MAG: SipW-dependent-type signal peptide-containing protein [Patescibacteria group bacterium]
MKQFLKQKNVLVSFGVIGIVALIAVSASYSFFADTEESTANTFTAGGVDLQVDNQSHYNGLDCQGGIWVNNCDPQSACTSELEGETCDGTWSLTDLGPSHKFFNFNDLKPGDFGEATISLHVSDNDSYVCAIIDNLHNDDLGLTGPEQAAGDDTDGLGNGELAEQVYFFAWADDGDNIWEAGEAPLFSNLYGPASDVLAGVTYELFIPATGAMPAGTTNYLGIEWCFGEMTVDSNQHTVTCDGSTVSDVTQTDKLTADITFYIEQSRHNQNFVCPETL